MLSDKANALYEIFEKPLSMQDAIKLDKIHKWYKRCKFDTYLPRKDSYR